MQYPSELSATPIGTSATDYHTDIEGQGQVSPPPVPVAEEETRIAQEIAKTNEEVAHVNTDIANENAQLSEVVTVPPQQAQPPETVLVPPQQPQQTAQPTGDPVALARQALQNALQALSATTTVLNQLNVALDQSPLATAQALQQTSLRTQANMVAEYGKQALTLTNLAQQNLSQAPQVPQAIQASQPTQANVALFASPINLAQGSGIPDGLQQILQVVQTIAPLFEIFGALL